MNQSSYRLLLVLDDPEEQGAFLSHVRQHEWPYDCSVAANVPAALERLGSGTFDVVLTGLSSDDESALELIDEIPELPIIFMVAPDDRGAVDRAMQANIFNYVQKDDEHNYLKFVPLTIENAIRMKSAELQLRGRHNELLEFLDTATDLIQRVTAGGQLSYVNRAWERAMGYSRQDVIGTDFLDYIAPESREYCRSEFARITGGESIVHLKAVFLAKDRRRVYVEGNAGSRVRDGRVIETRSIFHDVTESRKNQDELREARDSAEAANRAKGVFLSRMSHEIRTPLNAIIAAADMLAVEPNNREDYVRLIKQGSSNLLSIINDILELSAVEAGRMQVTAVDFAPAAFLRETIAPLKVVAKNKFLELTTKIASDLPDFIRADETKLRQILLNLIGNAIKFTDTGRVSVVAGRMGSNLVLKVSDSGPGIHEKDRDYIFEPYRRSYAAGKANEREGSGLGLAITRSLVELMGGIIDLATRVGEGSAFSVMVPFQSAEQAEVAPARDEAPNLTEKQVLLVEDNEVNVWLIERMLRNLGAHHVEVARNGLEAVEVARSNEFDVILMDRQMPEMDGLEATRQIRAMESASAVAGQGSIKILAITADAFEEDRQLCLAAGCDDCLAKPLSIQTLGTKLGQLLK